MEAGCISWIIANSTLRFMFLCMTLEGLDVAKGFFTYEALNFGVVFCLVIVKLYFCFPLETTLVTLEQHILKRADVLLPMISEVCHTDGYLPTCNAGNWVVMLFSFVLAQKNPIFALEAALVA